MNGVIRHFQVNLKFYIHIKLNIFYTSKGCYINDSEFKSQSFIWDLDINPTKSE